MSDDKVNKLNKANVPWIEIRGSPSFYRQGTKQWNINKPLKVFYFILFYYFFLSIKLYNIK